VTISPEPLRDVKESALFRTLSELVADLADLLQKELRLARAEISDNLSKRLQAGIWMTAAGLLGFLALLILLEAIIFGLVGLGLTPFWAALLVAVVLACLGGASYYKGRLDAERGLTPRRTIRQVKEDIRTTKEQLT
jgi:uncharacterized membrane protein YqjE